MRRTSAEEAYSLLPDNRVDHTDEERYQHKSQIPHSYRVPKWVVGLFMLFVALDIVIYLRINKFLLLEKTTRADLPIGHPYVGLDALDKPGNVEFSKYKILINVPILVTKISRAEPDRVFPVNVHQGLGDYGTLSPPDRNLHVTNTIHTIVQFRILDWGMEKCAFTVKLPAFGTILPHEYDIKDVRGTIRLDICEINGSQPLNILDLTWRKRPKCVKHVGTIDARVGEEVQLEPFVCQSGTLQAFEVSCASDMPNCGVNVWSNHNDTWGLYLTQYQTVV